MEWSEGKSRGGMGRGGGGGKSIATGLQLVYSNN